MLNRLTAAALLGLVALTGTIAVAPVAGYAQGLSNSRYFPEQAILDWSGQRFTVKRIDALGGRISEERERIYAWVDAYPDLVQALQRAVIENRALASALRARSVQLRNVVAIQQAFNGNLVIFLR
ncbi:hypothetical protein IHQ71_06210 [Rhizobium sp. TH2]|uniref:hypothetical protein n=1 Tax=Rhizobium sp. TH2 TaxID=2775403 RepID=UPI002158313E|nr:hypothetical protein [Rhizobium sp. TH2]UVC10197.1 hypothetical protein IHQ71_06210 [Rhizobium sp. TH2]